VEEMKTTAAKTVWLDDKGYRERSLSEEKDGTGCRTTTNSNERKRESEKERERGGVLHAKKINRKRNMR